MRGDRAEVACGWRMGNFSLSVCFHGEIRKNVYLIPLLSKAMRCFGMFYNI